MNSTARKAALLHGKRVLILEGDDELFRALKRRFMDPFSCSLRVKDMRAELRAIVSEYDSEPWLDVLIIDDSDVGAEATAFAIRRVVPEATVVRFDDRQEALRFIFGTEPSGHLPAQIPRLILLELGTPVAQGLRVLERLGSSPSTCEIPVVVLTATQDASAVEGSYLLGARGFIVKPQEHARYRDEVEGIIRRWLVTKRKRKNGA